ncbi:hypothetical protein K652_25326 [Pseudomonas aeruginosa VRFPA02]|nr:hypothetical protein K652_25326 [Pseudomonas aeruginosa VRFPA02]
MTIIHECDRCNAPGRVIETSDGFRCEACYEEAQEQVRSDASCPEVWEPGGDGYRIKRDTSRCTAPSATTQFRHSPARAW